VELPAPPGPVDLPGLVAWIVGTGPIEIVLVHPAGWGPDRIVAWARGPVVPLPAPLAVAGPGRRLVVDVGASGTEVTLVERGRMLARRRSDVGGARLDVVVAGLTGTTPARARRVREALSLLPEADGIDAEQLRVAVAPLLDELTALVRGVAAPVLLVGGVARSPLVAGALDEAGVADVVVAPRPEAAAVLGALGLPARPLAVVGGPGPDALFPPPPPTPSHLRRRVLGVAAGAAVAAGLLVVGTTPGAPHVAVPAGTLVQYGYRFALPAGWEHTGGLPERRRSLLTPSAAPESSDLIAVERTPLGYDAAAEPERARAELRAVYDDAVAAGDPLSDYRVASIAGRPVTTYRQREAGVVVEWSVVLDGDAQLSVGCRHTPAGEAAVRAACAVVVGSVRRD
jgi:type VII secretion-associated protein (TIGR03931 family)